MTMKRRLIESLVFSCALSLAAVACNGDKKDTDTDTDVEPCVPDGTWQYVIEGSPPTGEGCSSDGSSAQGAQEHELVVTTATDGAVSYELVEPSGAATAGATSSVVFSGSANACEMIFELVMSFEMASGDGVDNTSLTYSEQALQLSPQSNSDSVTGISMMLASSQVSAEAGSKRARKATLACIVNSRAVS